METLGIVYALVTVLAWGTWLAPSEKVQLPNALARAFYIAVGNLLLATIVLFIVGGQSKLSWSIFLYPFFGGLIWAVGALCAFTGIARIGMTKAFGIWAPLNIVVGVIWGMLLFGELLKSGSQTIMLGVLALTVIIGGILLIIFAGSSNKEDSTSKSPFSGYLLAAGAGVLWGTYFVPTAFLARNVEGLSGWITAFPLAVGMFVGSGILSLFSGRPPKCESGFDYLRVISSGVLWSTGNFAMLLMVGIIGMGKGFTIAQLCVVVNALIGIFVIKNPAPGTRAAKLTLLGVTLATIGGILLGNLKQGM